MTDPKNINIHDIPNADYEDFYKNFKEKLEDVESFPSLYTFKFILSNNSEQEKEINKIFEHPSTKITLKDSSKGKYKSMTIETYVKDADAVIDYYKKVASIKGVIML